jgi:hypothetical protein
MVVVGTLSTSKSTQNFVIVSPEQNMLATTMAGQQQAPRAVAVQLSDPLPSL